MNSLLPVFEELLDKAPDSGSFDAVRQSVVILMGCLARHLERDDHKIKPIVGKLIDALSTPSQQVMSLTDRQKVKSHIIGRSLTLAVSFYF